VHFLWLSEKGASGEFKRLQGMPQNFIECDREQVLLMPPSLGEWLPEDHLAWTILESVKEMDLSAFYGAYRADGHGRPAYEPAMMVALLLYAYARGNRSSRGIERACVEDVAYRVIAANKAPDHSTIAEFRVRHEQAVADLFGEVLGLCKAAGLVKVGVVAIDGTKVSANASMDANRTYRQIAKQILEEARRIDEAEDELYGAARGDELPEQLRTSEGRRKALREAKEKLDRERSERQGADEETAAPLELDPERFVTRPHGRRAWFREARRTLDERRESRARPIAKKRTERLKESARRLQEEHSAHCQANEAYESWRAREISRRGRGQMATGAVKPYQPPKEPEGKINTTDHDARIVRTAGQAARQGYNAQAAVNENHIVIAAEVTVESPDFGHLEPMVKAAERELEGVGVKKSPVVVVADAGYWHKKQMEDIVAGGTQVLIPPDSGGRRDTRPGWNKGLYAFMRRVLETEHGQAIYRRRMATVEPVFAQVKFNRRLDRFLRRGRAACRSEWRLMTATNNLIRLHNQRMAAARA
jgi:transposase